MPTKLIFQLNKSVEAYYEFKVCSLIQKEGTDVGRVWYCVEVFMLTSVECLNFKAFMYAGSDNFWLNFSFPIRCMRNLYLNIISRLELKHKLGTHLIGFYFNFTF